MGSYFTSTAGAIQPDEMKPGVDGKELQALRKKAGVPEIDPDAPCSIYATKMASCLEKRLDKATALKLQFEQIVQPSSLHSKPLC